jgi:hypothetical protein
MKKSCDRSVINVSCSIMPSHIVVPCTSLIHIQHLDVVKFIGLCAYTAVRSLIHVCLRSLRSGEEPKEHMAWDHRFAF